MASILLGLISGAVASLAEARGRLKNQARIAAPKQQTHPAPMATQPVPFALPIITQPVGELAASCGTPAPLALSLVTQPAADTAACSCSSTSAVLPVRSDTVVGSTKPVVSPSIFMAEIWDISKHLLPIFFGFTFIGYFLNGLIPVTWVTGLFGAGHAYSIPLAATLGLPFYINTEASLPLVRAMLDSGPSDSSSSGCSTDSSLYPADLLATLPDGELTISYGCGDPITLASLQLTRPYWTWAQVLAWTVSSLPRKLAKQDM